jgi:hypothetical protein
MLRIPPLDLAVGARPVGLRAQVLDPACRKQLAQRAVVDVGEGVVGHQPLGGDAVRPELVERSLDEGGDGWSLLIAVELDVGKTRMVVKRSHGRNHTRPGCLA